MVCERKAGTDFATFNASLIESLLDETGNLGDSIRKVIVSDSRVLVGAFRPQEAWFYTMFARKIVSIHLLRPNSQGSDITIEFKVDATRAIGEIGGGQIRLDRTARRIEMNWDNAQRALFAGVSAAQLSNLDCFAAAVEPLEEAAKAGGGLSLGHIEAMSRIAICIAKVLADG